MSYPTPMDIAESEDREADIPPPERLANICKALEEDLNESPFTREEWQRMDAERLELLAANAALAELCANRGEALLRETDRTHAAWKNQWAAESRLADVLAWLKDPRMKQWPYIESGDFYGDLADQISAIEKVISSNAIQGLK